MSTNKTFNKVQLDVKFTQATSRVNLISEENISISFGKISKYFADLHSQAFTGYTHPTYTARTGKPTGNQTPGFGSTFTISQITSDGTGHVTAATDRTVKIPDTTMGAASADAAGSKGLVPAPAAGKQTSFLRGDGTWVVPTNTTYSAGAHLSLSSTTFSLASYCKSITDWNSATTNGWYMGSSVTNAPSTEWWMGRVIAHNNKYCIQEVWNFSVSAPDNANPDAMYMSHKKRWFRAEHWGPWVDVSTPTPSAKVNCQFGTVASRTTNVTRGWMAYWDGSYNGSSSNLTYCNQGAFGTIVTKNTGDYVPNTQAGVNAAINLLSTGSSTPSLADYYVSQYANGGTTTTSYHRRPISALWDAFKGLITLTTTGSGNAVTAVSIANDGDHNRKITVTKGSTFSLSTHTHSNYLPMSTVSSSTDADTLFTTSQWINWNTTTEVETTHMPTTNYGILLAKAYPGIQVFIPDSAAGIYFRKKTNANTAATAWWGITGTSGSTYNLANFLTSSTQYISSIASSGSGNAVTSMSVSGGKLTYTLGSTFSLDGHDNKCTVTNGSTTSTNYGIVFAVNPNTTENNTLRKTNDFRYQMKDGAANTEGFATIILGNTKKLSEANNKSGNIYLYSSGGNWHLINTTSTTSNITHTLPATSGTILNSGTTSFTRTLSSGTKIGTIKIGGTSTDLYCQTNTNTTYTIATGDSNGQIKVTPSSGSAYNVSVKGLGSAAYTASTDYLSSSTKYAGSSSAGGPATNAAIARVTKNSKVFPGANKVIFEEYTKGTSYNLPSNHFYHIMSAQGSDTKYGTQLALGMTTTAAYYRVYNNQTWSDWKSLINTDTTYSANNGVGLSGTTFYNSGVRAVSTGSANGTISVNTNGTSADVAVKGLASAAYVTQESLLRARSTVSTDGGATGWSQIGINQYTNAFPDGVTNKIYGWGAVISMPAPNARFDLYYNHNSSTDGATTNGLQYRTGWNKDKKAWRMLIDNVNYTEYMPYKKPIKFQFNNGITNGYWAKLFSVNYSSYNILEIDIVTYHGYDGNFRSKLHIRFTNTGFVPGESSIISHQNIAPGLLRITQDDTNTFSLWIKCNGTSSRFGYEILNISDEGSVFFNGETLTAARWSFPTTFTKSDTAPTNAVTATRYFALDNHTHNYAGSSSAGGPALSVSTAGGDVVLGTYNSSSDDSGDIVWNYGNGRAKARLWQDNAYTAKAGPLYAVSKSDGTNLYSGRLPLADGTSASGTWGISITGNASTSTKATQDGDGNTISSTYLKLSGGKMAGTIQGTSTNTHIALAGGGIGDYATLDHKNNINISSWYGVSISNGCSNAGTLDQVTFSVNARTGTTQQRGHAILYSAGGDSPALIFQRGTFVDNLNDWKIYVSGGALYFAQSTANASSETWTNKMYFHASDGNLYVGSTKVSLEGHTHNYAGSSSAGGAATWATLLKAISTTTTASASTWNIPSGSYQVWGERFSDTRLKYTPSGGSKTTITDTGDLVMWLTGNATSNQATLNMRIDGTYYGSFSGNITGNVSGDVTGNVNGKLYHTGTSSSWWNDRDNAVIRITTGDTGYRPLWTLLTATSGSWGMGNHTGDDLTFNFISKAVYNSKKNPSTDAQIKFTNTGGITATGSITANKFYGDITGSGLNAGIYDLLNVDDPTFNGAEWMLTSIPSSPGGTSTPAFRRVKTAKFADYVSSTSRTVLFDQSDNTSTSISLSTPPTDTQYLKLYFKSSGNSGQPTVDNSVYSIAEVPYMTGVNLGGILQVAQLSDNQGVLRLTALAFNVKITTGSKYTLRLMKVSKASRISGSGVSDDSSLSANIIKVVAYR